MLTTFLFVPAHDARKVAKALGSTADAVILDLEDAVPEEMKGTARQAAATVIRAQRGDGPAIWVRVNAARTTHHEADVRAIDWPRAGGLLVPKVEEPASVQSLAGLRASAIMLTLESAAGFGRVRELVAAAPVLPRLAIGTWDLSHDLALPVDDPDESELIWHLRSEMVVISRVLDLASPVDGVYGRIDDTAGFEAMATRAWRLGFGGKLLIHPAQIPMAARIFGITEAQVVEAQSLVAAYEAAERTGQGAIRHEGQMVDRVHVERARTLLAKATKKKDTKAGLATKDTRVTKG